MVAGFITSRWVQTHVHLGRFVRAASSRESWGSLSSSGGVEFTRMRLRVHPWSLSSLARAQGVLGFILMVRFTRAHSFDGCVHPWWLGSYERAVGFSNPMTPDELNEKH